MMIFLSVSPFRPKNIYIYMYQSSFPIPVSSSSRVEFIPTERARAHLERGGGRLIKLCPIFGLSMPRR